MTKLARDPRALALLLASTLTVLSNATISPALPGLLALFKGTPHAELLTRMLVTAPSLLVAITAPLAGAAADRFGRRRQLLAGIVLFSIAGSAGLVLPGLVAILVSRLFLGAAVASMMTAHSALVGDYFTGPQRAQFMSIQLATTNFGGFLFISAAGVLAGISPRLPFAIYGVGLLLLPLLWRVIVEVPRKDAGDGDLNAPAQDASNGRPGHWQLQVAVAAALVGMVFVTFYALPTQLPFYLQAQGYADPSAAGQAMAALTLAGSIAALLQARFGPSSHPERIPPLGAALMALGFGLLSQTHSLWTVTAAVGLAGLGLGTLLPPLVTIVLNVAPAQKRGTAMGTLTTCIFMGQFLSPLVAQPLITSFSYATAFQVMTALLMGKAVVLWLWLRPSRPDLNSSSSAAT